MKKPIIFGFLGAIITILLSSGFSDLFQAWEWKTQDIRFRLRGPIPTDPNIILIDADDESAKDYGQWPWQRSIHAKMIEFLSEEKPSAIAYDILFAQLTEGQDDHLLSQSAKNNENVIFPVAVSFMEPSSAELTSGNKGPARSRFNALSENSNTVKYLTVEDEILPLPQLLLAANSIGHIAANRDKDGIIRRVPLLVRYQGRLLPSLGFQAVLNYLNISLTNVEVGKHFIHLRQIHFPGNGGGAQISVSLLICRDKCSSTMQANGRKLSNTLLSLLFCLKIQVLLETVRT